MRLAEDVDLWLRLSRHHRFVCTYQITANWGHRATNISGVDPRPYWSREYEARHRFLSVYRAEAPSDRVARPEAVARQLWKEQLFQAWSDSNADHLNFHLGMRAKVPDSNAFYRHYRRRTRRLPAVWL